MLLAVFLSSIQNKIVISIQNPISSRHPWENTFELRVSKYITANLFLFPRFDDASMYDDELGYFQFKEYSSLGFAYTF